MFWVDAQEWCLRCQNRAHSFHTRSFCFMFKHPRYSRVHRSLCCRWCRKRWLKKAQKKENCMINSCDWAVNMVHLENQGLLARGSLGIVIWLDFFSCAWPQNMFLATEHVVWHQSMFYRLIHWRLRYLLAHIWKCSMAICVCLMAIQKCSMELWTCLIVMQHVLWTCNMTQQTYVMSIGHILWPCNMSWCWWPIDMCHRFQRFSVAI